MRTAFNFMLFRKLFSALSLDFSLLFSPIDFDIPYMNKSVELQKCRMMCALMFTRLNLHFIHAFNLIRFGCNAIEPEM